MRPHALHPGAIQGKEGIKFCHLATLNSGAGDRPGERGRAQREGHLHRGHAQAEGEQRQGDALCQLHVRTHSQERGQGVQGQAAKYPVSAVIQIQGNPSAQLSYFVDLDLGVPP